MAEPEQDGAGSALIVIDMLNRYEHEDAAPLMESVEAALPAMCELLRRAQEGDLLIVYVNDNYGDWAAGRPELCERALAGRDPTLIRPVLPPEGAGFVTKARHSAFYETQLDYILRSNGIERVMLIGQVTEQCILYSALDAYVRHYSIVVPSDAVAHIHADLGQAALRMMALNMRAEVTRSDALLPALKAPDVGSRARRPGRWGKQ